MEAQLAAIVLAAGLGTRMCSRRAKVLHELAGEPMIARTIRAIDAIHPRCLVVVVGHQAREVESACRGAGAKSQIRFATQEQQRGTGDAASAGLSGIDSEFDGEVLIAYGDMPTLTSATLRAFAAAHRASASMLSFITVNLDDGASYGRVVRDNRGRVTAIVEARDASESERAIREINTGVYLVNAALLRDALRDIKPHNVQGEYYLTDIVAIAKARGIAIHGWRAESADEFAGINTREELSKMEARLREDINRKHMGTGVTFIDPAAAYISEQSEIGPDTTIGPNVQILGKCKIGSGVTIEGTAWLKNVTIGDRCHIKIGVRAEDCAIGEDSEIGPFANLRTGTELEGHNRIGNFVETKKAKIGRGTKASHLSYLGDAIIGRDTNVGCGVITVNYDGYDKHLTEIGSRCMIGCDTQLVAPVKVADDVYVASGTTIVRDVAPGALVLSHHPQREKSGWVAGWRKRHNDPTPVAAEAKAGAKDSRD